jgi:Leucine-rich repeat (LRR) protein
MELYEFFACRNGKRSAREKMINPFIDQNTIIDENITGKAAYDKWQKKNNKKMINENLQLRKKAEALHIPYEEYLVLLELFKPLSLTLEQSYGGGENHNVQIKKGHVTGLFLEGLNLNYLPANIGDLNYINRINIFNNNVQYIPESIRLLQRLEELQASHNKIGDLPREMLVIPTLKSVYLLGNPIAKDHDVIKHMKNNGMKVYL